MKIVVSFPWIGAAIPWQIFMTYTRFILKERTIYHHQTNTKITCKNSTQVQGNNSHSKPPTNRSPCGLYSYTVPPTKTHSDPLPNCSLPHNLRPSTRWWSPPWILRSSPSSPSCPHRSDCRSARNGTTWTPTNRTTGLGFPRNCTHCRCRNSPANCRPPFRRFYRLVFIPLRGVLR